MIGTMTHSPTKSFICRDVIADILLNDFPMSARRIVLHIPLMTPATIAWMTTHGELLKRKLISFMLNPL